MEFLASKKAVGAVDGDINPGVENLEMLVLYERGGPEGTGHVGRKVGRSMKIAVS